MSHQDQREQHEYSPNHPTPSQFESQQSPSGRKGPEGFQNYYRELYGERWSRLCHALHSPGTHYELSTPLCSSYFLDPASAEAAELVEIRPEMDVLDMCAAPGGKALGMIRRFLATYPGQRFECTLNERSSARRARLQRVLAEAIPKECPISIRVTAHDARRWGLHEQNRYDIVVLDAPCSSERHVATDQRALKDWSPKRGERLAIDAYAMLAAALTALRPGGKLFYMTCSIDPRENDHVVAKALKRRSGECAVLPNAALSGSESTDYGCIVLPDSAAGCGPLYLSMMCKPQ